MNREEHVTRCKFQAIEYVTAGDLPSAVSAMVTCMNQREDCKVSDVLTVLGMRYLVDGDSSAVLRWIKGFR